MFKHILLAADGSPASETAARRCIAFAREIGARVTALHVVPQLHTFTYEPGATEEAHEQFRRNRDKASHSVLDPIVQLAGEAGVPCTALLSAADEPYQAIIETARDEGCDLIAMTSHGHRGIGAVLLGGQTQKVLTHSAIPALVYR